MVESYPWQPSINVNKLQTLSPEDVSWNHGEARQDQPVKTHRLAIVHHRFCGGRMCAILDASILNLKHFYHLALSLSPSSLHAAVRPQQSRFMYYKSEDGHIPEDTRSMLA